MTPKEKAQELYDKIHFALPSYHDEGQQEHKSAKECAIIAVDEMLNELDHIPFHDDDYAEWKMKYWKQVKEEIEKL